jgi:hypothetical protein
MISKNIFPVKCTAMLAENKNDLHVVLLDG